MLKTTSLFYVVLLAVAFAVGLIGTLAASRALIQASERGVHRTLERPVKTPESPGRTAALPGQDC